MKNLVFTVFAILTLFLCSCKSTQTPNDYQAFLLYQQQMQQNQQSKQSSTVNGYGEQIQQDICEIMAEEKPGVRASGNAQHFKLSTAKNMAELQARAALAAALETAIINNMRDGSTQDEQYAANDSTGQYVTDGMALSEQDIKAISLGVVKNAVVIKTSTYIKPNKQYNVFVCVEYSNDLKQVAQEVTSKIEQMIPNNKKEELKGRLDGLAENIEQSLSKFSNK